MKIYRIIPVTKAEGPGKRAALWVQGCPHRCKGCFAHHLWDYDQGTEMSAEDVINIIRPYLNEISGLTILGGEPFEYAEDLWQLASFFKQKGKNVITFTGYMLEELVSEGDEAKQRLIDNTDLLVDGPFIEEKLDYSRPLVGSSNQRFIFLTDKISKDEIYQYNNLFELRMSKKGRIQINGMGNINKLQEYLGELGGFYYGKRML